MDAAVGEGEDTADIAGTGLVLVPGWGILGIGRKLDFGRRSAGLGIGLELDLHEAVSFCGVKWGINTEQAFYVCLQYTTGFPISE
jgi:hypothetical protein